MTIYKIIDKSKDSAVKRIKYASIIRNKGKNLSPKQLYTKGKISSVVDYSIARFIEDILENFVYYSDNIEYHIEFEKKKFFEWAKRENEKWGPERKLELFEIFEPKLYKEMLIGHAKRRKTTKAKKIKQIKKMKTSNEEKIKERIKQIATGNLYHYWVEFVNDYYDEINEFETNLNVLSFVFDNIKLKSFIDQIVKYSFDIDFNDRSFV